MSKAKASAPAAPAAKPKSTVSRTRRSAFERKSLTKESKRLFGSCSKEVMRMIRSAEAESRKKKPASGI